MSLTIPKTQMTSDRIKTHCQAWKHAHENRFEDPSYFEETEKILTTVLPKEAKKDSGHYFTLLKIKPKRDIPETIERWDVEGKNLKGLAGIIRDIAKDFGLDVALTFVPGKFCCFNGAYQLKAKFSTC
ncbi:MAG: hypothetical protein CMO81_09245 [Waddliaceae bacterium]|nr:hypothetical protein [Waddliaceae bacterium]